MEDIESIDQGSALVDGSNVNSRNGQEEGSDICSVHRNDDFDSGDFDVTPPAQKKRKGGRPSHTVWEYLTLDDTPQSNVSSSCRHCHEMVSYHKKSEQAVYHLNHCKAFKACMLEMNVSDHPPWFKSVSRSNTQASPLLVAVSKAFLATTSPPPGS